MNESTPRVCVRDVMKTEFGLIEGSATIFEALLLMKKLRTSLLVVDKRHEMMSTVCY